MTDLPAPLTPADCNLQDFAFMPLDVRRLLASETWVLGTGDERSAAMCLWLESWHQIPAASLPDNQRMLAHLAQTTKWPKVKEQALRGWVLCSDGRLYHPVVAVKALEAWVEKLLNSISGAAGNAKRWGVEVDVTRMQDQFRIATALLKAIAPESRTLKKKAVISIASGSPPDSPPDRKGQGQGQGLNSEPIGSGGAAADKKPRTAAEQRKSDLWRSIKTLLVESGESKDMKAAGAIVTQAINRYDEAIALSAIEATLHARPAGAIAFLEAACQQASGHRLNKQEALEAGNLAAAERFAME